MVFAGRCARAKTHANDALQVKRMLYPPYGVGERWPIKRGEAKHIIRLTAEKKKLHMMFIIIETSIASETIYSNNGHSRFQEV